MSDLPSRYSRQILFPGLGKKGQDRLIQSRVVIVGCGALGTVQAESLCRAGVGNLLIVDRDFIEESNLQRQVLFTEQDMRESIPKAVAAKRRLEQINSLVRVEAQVTDVNYRNVESLVAGADCILDGTDNFESRYLLNDVSQKHQIPWVYGGVVGSKGLTMTIVPGKTPCLRCVFESPPSPGTTPTCDTAGVLSPAINVIASLQVAETFKILTGKIKQINRKLLCVDIWQNTWQFLATEASEKRADCPTCHSATFDFLDGQKGSSVTSLCGRNSVQINQIERQHLNLPQLAQRLQLLGSVSCNQFFLRFKLKKIEIAVFPDGRAIIRGTRDQQVARSLYSRYIGA